MRALAIALVVTAASSAQASPFIELGGGLIVPLSDSTYTDSVDPSVGLAARIGAGGKLAGMFSFEWDPLASNLQYVSFNRFRFLGHVVLHHAVSPTLELTGRLGAGIDLLHESTEGTILGVRFQGSDSNLGLALELGAGGWFSVGSGGTQVGVELAIPIGYHTDDNTPSTADNANWDFTSVDLQILGGLRLRL